jgi:hypothetical protein
VEQFERRIVLSVPAPVFGPPAIVSTSTDGGLVDVSISGPRALTYYQQTSAAAPLHVASYNTGSAAATPLQGSALDGGNTVAFANDGVRGPGGIFFPDIPRPNQPDQPPGPGPVTPGDGDPIWLTQGAPPLNLARWPGSGADGAATQELKGNATFSTKVDLPPLKGARGRSQEFELAATPSMSDSSGVETTKAFRPHVHLLAPASAREVTLASAGSSTLDRGLTVDSFDHLVQPLLNQVSPLEHAPEISRRLQVRGSTASTQAGVENADVTLRAQRLVMKTAPRLSSERSPSSVDGKPGPADEPVAAPHAAPDGARPDEADGAAFRAPTMTLVRQFESHGSLVTSDIEQAAEASASPTRMPTLRRADEEAERFRLVDMVLAAGLGLVLTRTAANDKAAALYPLRQKVRVDSGLRRR